MSTVSSNRGSRSQRPAGRAAGRSAAPGAGKNAPLGWRSWLAAWLWSPEGSACATSLSVHLTILICLSLVVFRPTAGGDQSGVSMQPGDGEGGGSGFDNVLGQELEASVGSVELESASSAQAPAVAAIDGIRPAVDLESTIAGLESTMIGLENASDLAQEISEARTSGRGRGSGTGIGNLTDGFTKPGNGRVVKKGKFVAWTVPADPLPMQDYLIVIQVEWPTTTDKKAIRSRRNDLTGTVTGSDNYLQIIERSGVFIPKTSQMVVPVPGADQYVRDVIRVRSKLLEESQELTITF